MTTTTDIAFNMEADTQVPEWCVQLARITLMEFGFSTRDKLIQRAAFHKDALMQRVSELDSNQLLELAASADALHERLCRKGDRAYSIGTMELNLGFNRNVYNAKARIFMVATASLMVIMRNQLPA